MSGRWILGLFALALAVRLLNMAFLSQAEGDFFFDDSPGYWREAGDLLVRGWFHWIEGPGTTLMDRRPPGYVYFLATVRLLFGESHAAVAAVQAVLDAGSCVLIGLVAARLAPPLGRLSGILAALWPNMVIHSSLILSDTFFLFLFTLMLWCSARFLEKGDWRWSAGAGAWLGLATVVRTLTQFLIPVMAAAAAAVAWRSRRGWRGAALAAGLFVVAVLPLPGLLIARNAALFDSPSLTAQAGGHLLFWVIPQVQAAAGIAPEAEARERLSEAFAARIRAEGRDAAAMSYFALGEAQAAMAREELAGLPAGAYAKAWLTGIVGNLVAPPLLSDPRVRALPKPSFSAVAGSGPVERVFNYLFRPFGPYQALILAGLSLGAATLLFQAWGFLVLVRRNPWTAFFAGGLVLYVLVVTGPVIGPKYRLPAEPVLIVLTALALGDLVARARRRAAGSL